MNLSEMANWCTWSASNCSYKALGSSSSEGKRATIVLKFILYFVLAQVDLFVPSIECCSSSLHQF